uniref:Uncharacterized protein n=1 Tax=Eutreptiella gymnastica TaxID=73025 RepID=A0A7S1ICF3_9EUGL
MIKQPKAACRWITGVELGGRPGFGECRPRGARTETPVSAQIPKAIRQLYRWHKGNRPYTEPKAGGSRQAPTLAQVEQLCWERKIATKKQNRQLPARDQTPKSEG